MKTNKFSYKKEAALSPYIGLTSFQHFRNDKLYSDVIVRPEGGMCETENLECFPIPDYVPQEGRSEGYYPDSTVAYIRILWKEFEPEQGEYNYAFIEDFLNRAKADGQTVCFRLMAHSTRECDDLPYWLKKLIPCPERPEGKRVKDSPTDPLFIHLFAKAIRAIGQRFDSDPTLSSVDMTLPGSWGEGHNLELYPDELIYEWVDAYAEAFQKTPLFGQVAKPHYIARARAKGATVGWRADGFGDPWHLEHKYPALVAEIPDVWKEGPVAFESYWWLGEWQRKGWNIDYIIDLTLKWHLSQFNAKSIPIPNEWQDKIDAWVDKMGYHFMINSFSFPETAVSGDRIELGLEIENLGVAPMYNPLPLILTFKGNKECSVVLRDNLFDWLPGRHTEGFSLILPELEAGRYDITIGIYDDAQQVYFCTDAPQSGKGYKVGEITVK